MPGPPQASPEGPSSLGPSAPPLLLTRLLRLSSLQGPQLLAHQRWENVCWDKGYETSGQRRSRVCHLGCSRRLPCLWRQPVGQKRHGSLREQALRDSEGMRLSLIPLEGQGGLGVPVCNWLRAPPAGANCPELPDCQCSGDTCSLSQKKPPDRRCRCWQPETLDLDGDQRDVLRRFRWE